MQAHPYVARSAWLCTKTARIEGYRLALHQAGLGFIQERICAGDTSDPKFCKSLLKLQPDGIVCFHDPVAILLIQNFMKLGVAIPDQIKIIGLVTILSTPVINNKKFKQPFS